MRKEDELEKSKKKNQGKGTHWWGWSWQAIDKARQAPCAGAWQGRGHGDRTGERGRSSAQAPGLAPSRLQVNEDRVTDSSRHETAARR